MTYDRPPDPYDEREGRYPSMPPPDGPVGPQPPSSILAAVKLMYVGAGLQALGIAFTVATRGQLRDQMAAEQPELTGSELDLAVNIAVGGVVVVGLLAVAMWIWMARANRRGLAWARIVATVLGGLNIAFTLFSLSQTAGWGTVVQLITIALAGSILFLLYRPDSTAYYNAVSHLP